MRETKLKRLILGIYIGAFVLLVAVVLVWKLKFYDNVNAQIATEQTAYEAAKTKAAGLDTAQRNKVKADQKLRFAQAQLDYLRLRFRSISLDVSTPGAREATFARYLSEYTEDYGLALRRQLLTAANETGVQLETKAAVDIPPQLPEDLDKPEFAPASGFLKPLTTESLGLIVTGTLPEIMRFLDRINHSEILLSVGYIKVDKGGTSGGAAGATAAVGNRVTATFTVTPYLLTTGPSAKIGTPPAPAGATPASAPATGVPTDPAAVAAPATP